ncbi:MAG: glycosyltransferase, partial [archaeon]
MEILIIKIGALGDVLRTSFIAQALKDKYRSRKPRIHWITDEKALPLFTNNPYIYEVVKKEQKEKFLNMPLDLIINLEEDEENCRFVSSLKSKEVRGFIFENGRVLPTKTTEEWFNMSALGKKPQNDILKKKNEKEHRQIISEIVGITNWTKYEPFLRLCEEQRKIASDFLRRHNLSRTDLIVGINTGAADRWPKHLSIEKTANLIDRIYKKYNASILLFGGPNEIERNKKIMSLSHSPIITTGCGNDLNEFPALINVFSILITSDTLGLHIGLALKRKTIILVGPTSPAEIGTYHLGEKVVAKSDCICCYKHECKSMEKISIDEILEKLDSLIKQKITWVITAFKEPKTIGRAIESAQNQKTNYEYNILVSAPDKETLNIAKEYSKKDKRIKVFRDSGKGKSLAINLIISKLKSDLLILTDGDVYPNNLAVEDIANLFLDPEIGCATGRPIPKE